MISQTQKLNKYFGIVVNKYLNLKLLTKYQINYFKKMLAQEGLILFRDQALSDQDIYDLGCKFGNGHFENSARKQAWGKNINEIVYLTNIFDENHHPLGWTSNTTDYWHSDQEFREKPASLAATYCVIPSNVNGNTSFASTALERIKISKENLDILSKLWSTRKPAPDHDHAPKLTVAHPVIHTNPYTNRKYLYVSEHLLDFIGEEVENLQVDKNYLLNQILAIEGIYSHIWHEGDFIIYDNTQMLHRREEFRGIRLLKTVKIFPDENILFSPKGKVIA